MKRILRFLPILLMLCFTILGARATTLYVSDSGSDTAAGTASAPYKTLPKAFSSAAAGDKIIISGTVTLSEDTELSAAGAVTVAGADASATLVLPERLSFGSDVTLENLTLHSKKASLIFCQGHNITFGSGLVNTVASSAVMYPQIWGGTNCKNSGTTATTAVYKDFTVTVKSGTWYHLHGGSLRSAETQPVGTVGNITVNIEGGKFTSMQDNASTNAVIALTGMDALHGDATLNISGGSFGCAVVGLGRPGYNATTSNNAYAIGNIAVNISGGSFTGGHIGMAQDTISSTLCGNFTLRITGGEFADGFSGFDATATDGVAIADVLPALRRAKPFTAFDDNLYVSAAGSDANDGLSADTPKATVTTAGGVIHLCGEVPTSALNLKSAEKPVTVEGGTLRFDGMLSAGSDLTLRDTVLAGTGTISAAGHNLTVAASVSTEESAAIAINGGKGYTRVLTLCGGSFTEVRGGSLLDDRSTAYTVIDGATVGKVVGAETKRSAILLYSGHVTGNLYAFSNGGVLGAIHLYGGSLDGQVVDSGYATVSEFAVYTAPEFGGEPTVVATRTVARTPVEDAVFVGAKNTYGAPAAADLAAAVKTGKTVVVCDTLSLGNLTLPASGRGTRITSAFMGVSYADLCGAKLSLSGTVRFSETTVLSDLVFEAFTNTAVLSAEGKPLSVGEGVSCTLFPNKRVETYPMLCGGSYQKAKALTASPRLSIASGTWGIVSGGSYHATAAPSGYTLSGDVEVTVTGGRITKGLYLSGRDTLKGNATLTVTGGIFDCSVFGAADASPVSGNITINLSGGAFRGDIGRARDGAAAGKTFTLSLRDCDLSRVGKIRMDGGALNLSGGISLTAPVTGEGTFQNPIAGYADPSVVYADGWYYYTYAKSFAGGQGIYMAKATNLFDIGKVEPQLIWSQTVSGQAPEMTALWAPQLYRLTGEDGVSRWYIYGAAQTETDANTDANLRLPYVWVGQEDDPTGEYTFFGCMENLDTEAYTYLSQRFLYYGGKMYMFCSGFFRESDVNPHIQRTRVCEMESPTKMKSKQIVISSPSCDYEYSGSADAGIQEGPFPLLAPNGKLYLLFAAGHTRTDYYCTGILTFTGGENDSLLNPNLWVKSETAFQFANMEGGVYSPGAMVVTTSPDGAHYYGVYHAKNYHLSAYTMRRMYMQEIFFDAQGVPYIDEPQPIDTVFTAPLNSLPLSARIFDVGSLHCDHNYTETAPAVPPTCTEGGKTAVETCTVCGDVRGGETVAKLGHDYIETEAEIPPSYEADGKTAVYTCSRCGDVCGGEPIPKYVLTPGSGDADLDGKVTVKDALHTLRILVNSLAYSETADADLNGRITLSDVLRILKCAAEGT